MVKGSSKIEPSLGIVCAAPPQLTSSVSPTVPLVTLPCTSSATLAGLISDQLSPVKPACTMSAYTTLAQLS